MVFKIVRCVRRYLELPEAGPHGQCRTEENCVFQLCSRNTQLFLLESTVETGRVQKSQSIPAHTAVMIPTITLMTV